MSDKKKKSETGSQRILRETELDPSGAMSLFPTVEPGTYETLAVQLDGFTVAYLAMELPPGAVCVLHLTILPEEKKRETIERLIPVFYEEVHPWVQSKGKSVIAVHCDYEDTKTKDLFKTFGFEPAALWMGSMLI